MNFKGSMLVVDDEESILSILEQFLAERKYDVETARTGEQALKLLETKEFDVALLDLKLPDCSGLELINLFNEASPDMKCIIMTAFASLESTIEALRLNAFDYILKPFDLVKIGEIVDAAFNHVLLKRENIQIIKRLESANRRLEESKKDLSGQILRANEELAEANNSLKKHVTRLKMLYQMGRDISSNENWSDALDRFLMALYRYLDADGAGLLLFSDFGRSLKVRTYYHIEEEVLERAVKMLIDAQQKDTLPAEIFNLESCADEKPKTCLEMNAPWDQTVIPLLYKGRWLGFLLIRKAYKSRRAYLKDYHFINTIQTILTEEVANAVNISRLRNLKDFNETILENINNGVLTTNKAGRVIFTNSRAKEILGSIAEGEIHFNDLFTNPFERSGLFEYLISSEDRSCSLEGALSLPGGNSIPIRLNTTKVEADDYSGSTVVAVFEDLTDQKAMEEELRRSDRLRSLGELSAGVAHEIRNPLTCIATTAQVLREKLVGEAEKIKYLVVILDEINRLDNIIKNLLSFARPIFPNPVELSIQGLLEDAMDLLSEKAAEKDITFRVESELDDAHCFLDRDQIKQVVLNIVLNGIQACNAGGELAVHVRDSVDPAFIQIEFVDRGEGIPAEISEKLYNPFFTTRSQGTGLGLSISRKIVESHGGRIFHRSEVGTGTSFFIELPRRMIPTGKKEATKIP